MVDFGVGLGVGLGVGETVAFRVGIGVGEKVNFGVGIGVGFGVRAEVVCASWHVPAWHDEHASASGSIAIQLTRQLFVIACETVSSNAAPVNGDWSASFDFGFVENLKQIRIYFCMLDLIVCAQGGRKKKHTNIFALCFAWLSPRYIEEQTVFF